MALDSRHETKAWRAGRDRGRDLGSVGGWLSLRLRARGTARALALDAWVRAAATGSDGTRPLPRGCDASSRAASVHHDRRRPPGAQVRPHLIRSRRLSDRGSPSASLPRRATLSLRALAACRPSSAPSGCGAAGRAAARLQNRPAPARGRIGCGARRARPRRGRDEVWGSHGQILEGSPESASCEAK